MWSLKSPRAKRICGPKKSHSSPKKDFFNNICQKQTCLTNEITEGTEVRKALL
jgi:hypothetical protein